MVFSAAVLGCGSDEPTAPPVTESVFLPADAPTVEGNSGNSSPFEQVAGRFQSVYSAGLLGIPAGSRITGMRFRLDGAAPPFNAVTISNFEIRLSTSVNPPGSLSATFAANRGDDEVIVRTGPLSIAPADYPTGGTPNAFGPTIQFSQPFTYQGGSLLLEVGYTGLPAAEARGTDNVFPATESQSGYGLVNGFDAASADAGLAADLIVVEYRYIRP
jgi:hypothetical protein